MSNKIPDKSTLEKLLANPQSAGSSNLDWLAGLIDHTLLKPEATDEQHKKLCEEAIKYKFATVCVYPSKLELCASYLKNSQVKPIAVVGFPTGNVPTEQKVKETKDAIQKGALEIDMVIAIDELKKKNYQAVLQDMQAVVSAAGKIPVKVILETCLLTQEEKISACALTKAAGAAFVKTSTGFSTGGATVEDITLMRQMVGTHFGVKASGGVRNFQDAIKMVLAGANRIGTSAGVEIVSGKTASSSY